MNWPTEIPAGTAQQVSDAQAQLALERSGSAAIAAWQTQRVAELVQWLLDQVPWWRERLGPKVDLNDWAQLPVLSRFELRQMVAMHGCAAVPAHHGEAVPYYLAGPPGGAVRFYTSRFNQRMVDHAFYADHQRQGRNPYAHHACLTDDLPLHTGPHLAVAASLESGHGPQSLRKLDLFTTQDHVRWLQGVNPTYLTTTPQWLEAALDLAQSQPLALPEIRHVLTFGAAVPSSLRRKVRTQLGGSVRHRYTCLECGPLAFQCPRSDDYFHVAVGNVLLEVAPTGAVLVTALHQYATPLLRHDIGDTATLHPQCPGCSTAVPTLSNLTQNA